MAEAVEGSIDEVTLLGLFLATAMLTLIGLRPNPVAPIIDANLNIDNSVVYYRYIKFDYGG